MDRKRETLQHVGEGEWIKKIVVLGEVLGFFPFKQPTGKP